MKKWILVAALLSGCSTYAPVDWYQSQGFNLINCGPAVAATATSWAGVESTTAQARAFNKQGSNGLRWWSMSDIHSYIESKNVNIDIETYQLPRYNELGIYHVYSNHFVSVERIDDDLYQVYDPLSFSINDKVSALDFTDRVTGGVFLRVSK